MTEFEKQLISLLKDIRYILDKEFNDDGSIVGITCEKCKNSYFRNKMDYFSNKPLRDICKKCEMKETYND